MKKKLTFENFNENYKMKVIGIFGKPEHHGYPKGTRIAIIYVPEPVEIVFIPNNGCYWCVHEAGRAFSQNPTYWEAQCVCEVNFEVFNSVADAEKQLRVRN